MPVEITAAGLILTFWDTNVRLVSICEFSSPLTLVLTLWTRCVWRIDGTSSSVYSSDLRSRVLDQYLRRKMVRRVGIHVLDHQE